MRNYHDKKSDGNDFKDARSIKLYFRYTRSGYLQLIFLYRHAAKGFDMQLEIH